MALINYSSKEITLKIVYYGPGLSGKTTNLQRLHSDIPPERRGKLISLSTETDRTLFFDLMPVSFGNIRDFSLKLQLYTVPGQVRYNATRKLVLKGADAVVFVADSQRQMREENIESWGHLRENLRENSIDPKSIPLVLQYNKRDLSDILTDEELDLDLNEENHSTVNAQAVNGIGVEETFQLVTRQLLKEISKKHGLALETAESPSLHTPPILEPEAAPQKTLIETLKIPESFEAPPEPAAAIDEEPVETFELPKPTKTEEPAVPIPQTLAEEDIEPAVDKTAEVSFALSGLIDELKESGNQLQRVIEALERLKKAVSG